MAILCFGGTFNPIHHGHLICARSIAEKAGYDAVLLIPSAQPPHKSPSAAMASPADRLEMCRRAIEGEPGFAVSDIECRRTGPSYTLLTARELKSQGHGRVDWLIGADSIAGLPRWHQPEALLEEVHFVVMGRPGSSVNWAALPEPFRKLEERQVGGPLIDISATEIRQRVSEKKPIDFLTPPAVVSYIRERSLYQAS